MTTTYIGLGSNLNNPTAQLEQAVEELQALPKSQLNKVSSFYQSKPVGPQDQDDFINAVVEIETSLSPTELFTHLQAIEVAHGRKRRLRWGPRTLDLDILLYGTQTIDTPTLQIPHPEMTNRAFVLVPLMEIAPGLSLPQQIEKSL